MNWFRATRVHAFDQGVPTSWFWGFFTSIATIICWPLFIITLLYHYFTIMYYHLPWFYHRSTMILPWFYHYLPSFSHGFPILFPADLVLKTPLTSMGSRPVRTTAAQRPQATQTLDDMLKLFTAPERLDKQNSWKRRGSTLVGSTLVVSGDGMGWSIIMVTCNIW